MTGLRTRRRSLAIAGALCLAAAALVAVTIPTAEDGARLGNRDRLRLESTVLI